MPLIGSSCKYRWSFACSSTIHLLLCGLVPNRLQTGTGPWPRGWGSLSYSSIFFLLNLKNLACLLEWCEQNQMENHRKALGWVIEEEVLKYTTMIVGCHTLLVIISICFRYFVAMLLNALNFRTVIFLEIVYFTILYWPSLLLIIFLPFNLFCLILT